MESRDLKDLVWKSRFQRYFRLHVLSKVPHSRLSPRVTEAFKQIKDRRRHDDRWSTAATLTPVVDWVAPILLHGGSWYHMGRITNGDTMHVDILVHGLSGALTYYEDPGIWPQILSVCAFNIFDIAANGLHPDKEEFSLKLSEDQWAGDRELSAVCRVRHHLRRQIGEANWLDNRKPEHIEADRRWKKPWGESFSDVFRM